MSRRNVVLLSAVLGVAISMLVVADRPDRPAGEPGTRQATPVSGRPAAGPAAHADPERVRGGALSVRWPAGGVREVDVPASGVARLRGLPVSVSRAGSGKPTPAKVRIDVADREAAERSGVDGVLLRVRRSDGGSGTGTVVLSVGYRGFRDAYGGDWAGRLRLVALSGGQAVSGRNDVPRGQVTAAVAVGAATSTYAVTAGASGSTGSYAATSLSPDGSWNVEDNGGDFRWSYPIDAPDVPGELKPELSLGYSSGSVDGRVASTNNQPSWVGEGWQLWPGFIERQYKPCRDDAASDTQKTFDLCWAGLNATLSYAGLSGDLLRDDTTGAWKPRSDDGTKAELLKGFIDDPAASNGNGDNDGEYWRLTKPDGTKLYFGVNRLPGWVSGKPTTNSAWTAPVFGNGDNEPCHGSTFATSMCDQAYRWNLDYVVDPNGNTISYWYGRETNNYAQRNGATTDSYVRGGWLTKIEYGSRRAQQYSAAALAMIDFVPADRCAAGADCTQKTTSSWPDTPWDHYCNTTSCADKWAPTFWSSKRLSQIITYVHDGTAYREVDSVTLDHAYPKPTDGTTAALWLNGITRTGLARTTTVALPKINFDGTWLPNRLNTVGDGLPPMNKYRIHVITTESGGKIVPEYAATNCAASALPTPDSNTQRCFPVKWTPEGAGAPYNDWFHKYVVDHVNVQDPIGGNPTQVTYYDYEGGAAWAYDDNPMTDAKYRTWSQWRGYGKVLVTEGGLADTGAPRSVTRRLYFRGMNGDKLSGGGTRSASVVDSEGVSRDDDPQYAGFLREEIVYNGEGGSLVTGVISDPWQRGPTSTDGARKAYQVQVGRQVTRSPLAAGGLRRVETRTDYDGYALPIEVDDLGDTSTTYDDRCTRTSYARNTGAGIVDTESRVETVSVRCSATAGTDDVLSEVRTYYDGSTTLGAAPSEGNPTRVESLQGWVGTIRQYVVDSRTSYDAYGRGLDTYDALGHKTMTRYTPGSGLPTSITVTNPLGHVTTSNLDLQTGAASSIVDANGKTATLQYDALGRLTAVWLPGRSTTLAADVRYGYAIRNTAPSYRSTRVLKPNGNTVTSYTLYDGHLRERQTQAPAWGGDRVVTDTYHDERGLAYKKNAPYYMLGTAGTTLMVTSDDAIPSQTLIEYDGAERATAEILLNKRTEKWRTTTSYLGDRTRVTPPSGGTPTATYTDADGHVTALREYPAGFAGAFQSTGYTYTKAGELATVTDAAGNVWRYGYDLRGNRITSTDPDRGATSATFDALDRPVTGTDACGNTLHTSYDALGRRTALRRDSATGTLFSEWAYDTIAKGQLTSGTRYAGGGGYVTAVTGYDNGYRPTGVRLTIPAVGGPAQAALAGTYTTTMAYKADGSLSSVAYPALGNLAAETVVYGYDDLGMPATATGAASYVTDTRYTPTYQLMRLQLGPTGKRLWRSHYYEDHSQRLTQVTSDREVPNGTPTTANDTTYGYDPAGNVTSITDITPGLGTDTQCFGYDGLRRLTEAWTVSATCGAAGAGVGGPEPYWLSYTYDAVGNRTSETRHGLLGAGDTVSGYAYPAAGSARPHAVSSVTTGATVGSYGYDAAGNTTSRPGPSGQQSLVWHGTGELASADGTSYGYDADGNQLIVADPDGATLYLPNGELRADATGAKRGVRYYDHGGQAVAVRDATGVNYLLPDHHGTTTTLVNAATLAVTKRRFEPFGAPRGQQPASWPGSRGFVGGRTEKSTGLTRLGAREYDPATGRFLSVDPVVDTARPQALNMYAYALNNPVAFSDPTGLSVGSSALRVARELAASAGRRAATKRLQGQADQWRGYAARFASYMAALAARQRAIARYLKQVRYEAYLAERRRASLEAYRDHRLRKKLRAQFDVEGEKLDLLVSAAKQGKLNVVTLNPENRSIGIVFLPSTAGFADFVPKQDPPRDTWKSETRMEDKELNRRNSDAHMDHKYRRPHATFDTWSKGRDTRRGVAGLLGRLFDAFTGGG
ncbi:MAG: RHS repeat domain-containing protein [Micromonosporaceae bacterium]